MGSFVISNKEIEINIYNKSADHILWSALYILTTLVLDFILLLRQKLNLVLHQDAIAIQQYKYRLFLLLQEG